MYMYLAVTYTKEGIETPRELLATNQHTQSLKGQLLYYHISDKSQSRGTCFDKYDHTVRKSSSDNR